VWEMCAGWDEAERRWLVARRMGRCSFDDLARTHAWLCMFQIPRGGGCGFRVRLEAV
jgi:hypothetical protein